LYLKTKNLIEKNNVNTICMSANCPNRYECFSLNVASFMILGDRCSRNCLYCDVKSGSTKDMKEVDFLEIERIARSVVDLGLDYVTITSVTRDDLEDYGVCGFVFVIEQIRKLKPDCKIEVLIPDFKGEELCLRKIVERKPDVINHNIEVVSRLFSKLRDRGDYERSIKLIKDIKKLDVSINFKSTIKSTIITKSGFMVGLGESREEIIRTMDDLAEVGCDIITIGQYLKPNKNCVDVCKYYSDEEFLELKKIGLEKGFRQVECGKLVRSSYNAKKSFFEC
jgi:lipoyl synthase